MRFFFDIIILITLSTDIRIHRAGSQLNNLVGLPIIQYVLGELTGELPSEIPLAPGKPLPIIRRRVGTEFDLSNILSSKTLATGEEEQLTMMELEYEIQSKITSAAFKLANDVSAAKSVRRQRKVSYNQSQKKLKEIEFKLASIKHHKQKRVKQPRP